MKPDLSMQDGEWLQLGVHDSGGQVFHVERKAGQVRVTSTIGECTHDRSGIKCDLIYGGSPLLILFHPGRGRSVNVTFFNRTVKNVSVHQEDPRQKAPRRRAAVAAT